MKMPIGNKIAAAFGAALVAMILIGVVSYRSTTQFIDDTRRAAHTRRVLKELKELLSQVQDLETGVRGYVITGEESFLTPYRAAKTSIEGQVALLNKLIADPFVRERFHAVRQPLAAKVAVSDEIVEVRRTRGRNAASAMVQAGKGVRTMQSVRRALGEVEAAEVELLGRREAIAQADARQTLTVVAFGGFFGCAVVAAASLVIWRDLSQRKRAEAERDGFFTLSLDLLCIADPDGRFRRLNPAWAALGYTTEELSSKPYIEFIHPDDREATLAESQKLVAGGSTFSFENRYRCKDGSYRWLMWKSTPSPDGRFIYAAARDITERKRAEEEIRNLNTVLEGRNTALEAANKELEAFCYSVSHDLRAPLRGIDGFSQALLEDCAAKLDDDGRDSLHRIRASTQRMGQLIDDLLNLSRITRIEMFKSPVNLSEMARSIANELHKAEPDRQVEFVIAEGVIADADPRLIRVVLDNLLGNAWKFTGKRSDARIEFGSTGVNGSRACFVRDNGAGFDDAYAGKLFGAFQRLHAMDEFPGTGVGLATVQRILHRHGGRVWAEGAVGKGATFSFAL